ncbi:hypothetical protein [Pontibacterium sp.]|uniref:hypothetical protein n=1 Tax=Pontibacterium sp. TaxID=2036026 RepID=UPI0035639A38|nr:hypothetical protein [Oceanospirillaceae bacterium]
MATYGISDLLVESDFIWREIAVGDHVMVEADLYDSAGLMLKYGTSYLVLAKLRKEPGSSTLIVESDVTGELVNVHPALICSYENAHAPISYS